VQDPERTRPASTYRGIDLPPMRSVGTNLPPAWLITSAAAFPASVPAFSWGGQHADPAYGLTNLEAVQARPDGRLIVVVGSSAVRQIEPALRPWGPDGRIVPLFDEANRPIRFELNRDGDVTVVILAGVREQGEQLLLVHATYKSGDAIYIWRLDTSA